MTRRNASRALKALVIVAAVAGCGGDSSHLQDPPAVTGVMPDFSLLDVNPNSATGGQPVSPRDYVEKVSAWYFGHAT